MSKIMNSIRLMRWHLEYTIPRIMRNPTVYPEIPRKSAVRRLLENLYIYMRDGEPCVAYNGLGIDGKGRSMSDYASQYSLLSCICRILNPAKRCGNPFREVILIGDTQVPLLQDKYLFWSYLSRHGVPVVPVLAHSLGGELYDFTDGGLLKLDRFFAKPVGELCGAGTLLVTVRGGKHFDGSNPVDLKELVSKTNYLFQPIIENHAELKVFNPSSLNTLRIVSCRTRSGKLELWDPGMLRMGRANAEVDNFAKGGIGVGIDENGKLKRFGYAHDKNWSYTKMEEHPDSHLTFLGKDIPFYRESVDLVLKAHKLFPSFQTVGWDVAVTPDGPLLLEGNHNWDMEMLQIVHHKGATARFRDVYGK